VLLASGTVASGALLLIAVLPGRAPTAAIVALAALVGAAQPPLASCLRALWPSILRDPGRVHAAYAFEAVALELTYVIGPLLIAGAIASRSPRAALVVCAVLLAAGTSAFAAAAESRATRATAAALPRSPGRRAAGPLHAAGVRALLLTFACIAVTFGTLEVAIPAFAQAEGSRGAAGALLAVWGLGSMTGGLLAARLGPPADPPRRLALLVGGLAAGYVPLLLAPSLLSAAPLLVLAGLSIAPATAVGFGLLADHAPEGMATEAFAWSGTAFGGGLALGSAVGGALVQGTGPRAGFALAVAGALAGLGVALASRRVLTRPRAEAEPG
jgi:predicted MFS family arabinose efflux permease